jgi:hypothetical protein
MSFLTITLVISGILLGMWGLFHQLIVGGAVTMNPDADERYVRLFLMSWIAHGAYLSLAGFLPVVLLIFHDPLEPAVLTTSIILAFALTLLSVHVLVSARKFAITPVWIGLVLQSIHAALLYTFYFTYR